MSLLCPFEGCGRTFSRQLGLSQHIQQRHCLVESGLDLISEDDADEKLFEDLDLFKVNFKIQIITFS
jgi:hypothetical protein